MAHTRQRGAAIVTAMLVVALAASVVATLFYREHVAIRSVENRLALAQTRWIERAAIDWAKVILRADVRSGSVDHLGEPWAVPVADTRLDETVTAGAKISEQSRPAMLAGQMFDAQARFNLNNLVAANGQVSDVHLAAYRKLLGLIGLPESLADMLVARLLQSATRTLDGKPVAPTVMPLIRVTDLRAVTGYDEAVLAALEPYVTFLPLFTLVNINTARAEVIAAVVASMELASAKLFESRRERTFFQTLDQAKDQINGQPVLPPNMLSVGSAFFIVRGMVRYDRVEAQTETLLRRDGERIEVVWQQRF